MVGGYSILFEDDASIIKRQSLKSCIDLYQHELKTNFLLIFQACGFLLFFLLFFFFAASRKDESNQCICDIGISISRV